MLGSRRRAGLVHACAVTGSEGVWRKAQTWGFYGDGCRTAEKFVYANRREQDFPIDFQVMPDPRWFS